MKIAFTSMGPNWNSPMDYRFGRAEFLLIYDEEMNRLISLDNSRSGTSPLGAGPKATHLLLEQAPDFLITGHGPGKTAALALEKAGIGIYTEAGEMTVETALNNFKKGALKVF